MGMVGVVEGVVDVEDVLLLLVRKLRHPLVRYLNLYFGKRMFQLRLLVLGYLGALIVDSSLLVFEKRSLLRLQGLIIFLLVAQVSFSDFLLQLLKGILLRFNLGLLCAFLLVLTGLDHLDWKSLYFPHAFLICLDGVLRVVWDFPQGMQVLGLL